MKVFARDRYTKNHSTTGRLGFINTSSAVSQNNCEPVNNIEPCDFFSLNWIDQIRFVSGGKESFTDHRCFHRRRLALLSSGISYEASRQDDEVRVFFVFRRTRKAGLNFYPIDDTDAAVSLPVSRSVGGAGDGAVSPHPISGRVSPATTTPTKAQVSPVLVRRSARARPHPGYLSPMSKPVDWFEGVFRTK